MSDSFKSQKITINTANKNPIYYEFAKKTFSYNFNCIKHTTKYEIATDTALNDLTDIQLNGVDDLHILKYDKSSEKWVNGLFSTFLSGYVEGSQIIMSGGKITLDQSKIDHDLLLNFTQEEHRIINDSGTSETELWSASRINTQLNLKASSTHSHTESDILDLDRYTQSQVDTLLAAKAILGHTHTESDVTDLDKYTQDEITSLLSLKAVLSHTHIESEITDLDKYTQSQVDVLLAAKALLVHTHNDLYYTETELDNGILDSRYYTETELDALLALKASITHNHDSSYYTQGEVDTLFNSHNATYDHSELHSHTNKALLDTYLQTEANLSDAVSKKHTQNSDTCTDSNTFHVGDGTNDADKRIVANDSNPSNQPELRYHIATQKWQLSNNGVTFADIEASGIGNLSDLNDVDLTSLADGNLIRYNSTTGKWEVADYPTSAAWGNITGTLSSQTDLQAELDLKINITDLNYYNSADFDIDFATKTLDDLADGITYKRSHNDFTDTLKNKLDGIESLADVTDAINVTTALNLINVNELADITSAGADIESAVTLKHTQDTDKILLATTGEQLSEYSTLSTPSVYYSDYRIGQTFTPSISGTLSRITIWLYKGGTDSNIIVYVYAVDGNKKPTGSPLATETLTYANMVSSSDGVETDIEFSSPATLTAGTEYAIVFDDGISHLIYYFQSDEYSGGAYVWSVDGIDWSTSLTDTIYFKTFITLSNANVLNDGTIKSNISVDSGIKIDGRDISVDGIKLDGIEALADVNLLETVAGAPLTVSAKQITFNYDTDDFALDGNNLSLKEDGIKDVHIDWGTGAGQVNSDDVPDHNGHTVKDTFQHVLNRGKSTAITVATPSGLGITWTSGELYDEANHLFISTDAGSGNVTDNDVNYLKWVSGTTLTLSTSNASGDEILVAIFSVYDGVINGYRETSIMSETISNTRRALRASFPTRVISGMSVSEDTTVYSPTSALDVKMDAGEFYKDGIEQKTPAEIKSHDTALVRHYHTAGVWDYDTDDEIDTSNYDNPGKAGGQGLDSIPSNKWVKAYFIYMNGKIGWVYPTAYHTTKAGALDDSLSSMPTGLEPIPKLTAIVYQQGDTNFTNTVWQDLRAGISEESFNLVTTHNDLSGLDSGDYQHLTSAEHDELTQWLDDVTLGASGALTLPTGQNFTIGSTQWNSADSMDADSIVDGSTNAIITLTQETNFETAYTHSQDNSQAHSDYLLNNANDITTGNLTIQKVDPEIRLTDTGDSEYTRLTKADTDGVAIQYNRVYEPGSTISGLVAHWLCNDNEATTVVLDNTGTHNATMSANTNTANIAGKINDAFDFQDLKYFYVLDHADFSQLNTATISFWLNPDDVVGSQRLIAKDGAAGQREWIIGLNADKIQIIIGNNAGNWDLNWTSTVSVTASTWQHICVKWGSGNVYVYKNYDASTDSTVHTTDIKDGTTRVTIAADQSGGTKLNGLMDDIRIYNEENNDSARSAIYNSGSGTEDNIIAGANTEVQVWKSEDGVNAAEEGIQTYGDSDGRTVIDGKTIRFNIGGVEQFQIDANGDLDLGGNNLDNVGIIYGNSTYLRIGDAGTTNHSLASEDDLMVTGKLEVKGNTYLDGNIQIIDDVEMFFGTGYDCSIKWSTAGEDHLFIGIKTGGASNSGNIIIGDHDYHNSDYGVSDHGNPYLVMFSAQNPAVDNTQWGSLTHDQSDFIISSGKGDIKFSPADDLFIALDKKIQFGDTAVHVQSDDDGHLDLTADTSIDLNADTILGIGKYLYDADKDTGISIEETTDKDEIQMKVAGVEAFRIHDSGIIDLPKQSAARATKTSQTIATGTWTRIDLDTETFDVQGELDTTVNYKFVGIEAGYYQVNGNTSANVGDGNILGVEIRKNGARYAVNHFNLGAAGANYVYVGDIVYLDGVNDYIDLYGYQSSGGNLAISGILSIHKLS